MQEPWTLSPASSAQSNLTIIGVRNTILHIQNKGELKLYFFSHAIPSGLPEHENQPPWIIPS